MTLVDPARGCWSRIEPGTPRMLPPPETAGKSEQSRRRISSRFADSYNRRLPAANAAVDIPL